MFKDDDERIHFEGYLAEVRLWDVARSQKDIDAARACMLFGDEAGLAGYWPLNDGAGKAKVADRGAGKAEKAVLNTLCGWKPTSRWRSPGWR